MEVEVISVTDQEEADIWLLPNARPPQQDGCRENGPYGEIRLARFSIVCKKAAGGWPFAYSYAIKKPDRS